MNVRFSPLRHRASLCTFTAPLEEDGGMGGVRIGRMETGWGFLAASEIIGTQCVCVCVFSAQSRHVVFGRHWLGTPTPSF